MKRREEIREELEQLSPLLAKMKEEDPGFRVPENYFQQLPDEIMARMEQEKSQEASPSIQASWWDQFLHSLQFLLQPRYAMALAAILLLIVAGIWWLRPTETVYTGDIAWNKVSSEEITNYIANNIQDFEAELLFKATPGLDQQSILHGTDIDNATLDNYLEDIIDDLEVEDLEYLF